MPADDTDIFGNGICVYLTSPLNIAAAPAPAAAAAPAAAKTPARKKKKPASAKAVVVDDPTDIFGD